MASFRVLGTVEAWADERRLALGGPRQVTLLAFLLLNANRAVSADALIDAVWGPERDGAVKRLQMAIARLRKALGPLETDDGGALRTVGGGYLLSVGPGELDAEVFEDRMRDGRSALERGDARRASDLLAQALALWRGPALAQVSFEDFAQSEIGRLEELRLAALESRIEARLEFGEHSQLLAELEALTIHHPTRERLTAQLMLALYRSGRQAEALEVFQRARTRLAEELGLDPGPALQALQVAILEQAPTLDHAEPRGHADQLVPKARRRRRDGTRSSRRTASGSALLERDRELDALGGACETAASGEGRLVAVTGPSGIGKTALLTAAADAATEAGLTVVRARGGELERDLGWGMAVTIVEGLLSGLAGEQREPRFTGRARWAVALLGGDEPLGSVGEASPPEALEIVDGLTRFVSDFAAERPMALVIDDVQWADPPSLRWLVHLSDRLVMVPILAVTAIRSGDSEEAELLARLIAAAEVRLSPELLSSAATNAIVEDRLREPADQATRQAIFEITGGNPFLLDQLVRHLGASPLTPELVRAARPERLRSLIWPRLLRLGEDARALAQAVSVLGVNTPLRRGAALAGLSRSAATTAAERLAAEAIFEDALPLNFIHPLVRDVVVDGLTAARSDEVRRTAARVLLADGADAETAAVQLLGTEAVDEAWAADLLVQAGHRANARGAHESAARFFQRALGESLLPEDEQRVLRVARGRSLIAAGRQEGAVVLREALSEVSEPSERARLALEFGDTLVTSGQSTEAVDVYAAGALAAAGHDERLRLHILARRALALFAGPGAGETAMRAVAEVREATDAAGGATERSALSLLATVTFWQGAAANTCAQEAEQALATEPYAAGPPGWTPDLSWVLAILAYCDAYENRGVFLDDAVARAEADRAPGDLAAFAWWRSFGHMRQGKIRAAEADARTALGPFGHRTPDSVASASYAAILIQPLVARGAVADAQSVLAEFEREPDSDDLNVLLMLEARANLRRAQGRLEEARADLERLQTETEQRGIKWLGATSWLADLAIVLHLLGDSMAARRVAEDQLDRARAFGAPSAVGRALIAVAAVEARAPAVSTLEEAVSILGDSPARLDHARAIVALASAVREQGQREAAVSLLNQGMEQALQCGATPLVEAARRELRLAGSGP